MIFITIIIDFFLSLRYMIFVTLDWVSFLATPINLGLNKSFVVVVSMSLP
jgi:hypothetical protein